MNWVLECQLFTDVRLVFMYKIIILWTLFSASPFGIGYVRCDPGIWRANENERHGVELSQSDCESSDTEIQVIVYLSHFVSHGIGVEGIIVAVAELERGPVIENRGDDQGFIHNKIPRILSSWCYCLGFHGRSTDYWLESPSQDIRRQRQ